MKFYFSLITTILSVHLLAQATISPAPKQTVPIAITNATVHVGNGVVINNATVLINDGKIATVGTNVNYTMNAKVIDAKGKHVYPGFILCNTNIGLVDVNNVRATSDAQEIGDWNASVRSIVAYNAEQKVINTLRPEGVLLANIVPEGSLLSGSSSVVQLDAWTWEDAAYAMDNGLHFYMPSLLAPPPNARMRGSEQGIDPVKEGLQKVDRFKQFLEEAKAYIKTKAPEETNLKYAAVKGLFDSTKKLYVHAGTVKQMLVAISIAKELSIPVVIVGGEDSWQIAGLLKQNNIPVILTRMHTLPIAEDDDVDQPYKTPFLLQQAGILFAINDDDEQTRGRNLAFEAGTAAAYGLTKEQALSAITLNAARILGIDAKTGSVEVGKDANLFISDGDALDMRTNLLSHAFIQGREISLESHQTQLFDKYEKKYSGGK
ncbi:MAG: amidohydrolase family protein [Bacteroidota bacterium]|nr:amidohydrolase family protein [Bacteroidota bacterium]